MGCRRGEKQEVGWWWCRGSVGVASLARNSSAYLAQSIPQFGNNVGSQWEAAG